MYLYIYADFVQDKKWERELHKVENRLTDLGLSGKIARLALFRRAEDMVRSEIARGSVSTVVVVGDDETVFAVLDPIIDAGLTLGMIPIGPKQQVSTLCGVPAGVAACDILSARIVETIDVGVLNGKRFLTGIAFPRNAKVEIQCEDRYQVRAVRNGEVSVRNLAAGPVMTQADVSDPRDGRVDAVLKVPHREGWLFGKTVMGTTSIPLTHIAIRSQTPIEVLADATPVHGTRFDITVEPKHLRVITGKGRMF